MNINNFPGQVLKIIEGREGNVLTHNSILKLEHFHTGISCFIL